MIVLWAIGISLKSIESEPGPKKEKSEEGRAEESEAAKTNDNANEMVKHPKPVTRDRLVGLNGFPCGRGVVAD